MSSAFRLDYALTLLVHISTLTEKPKTENKTRKRPTRLGIAAICATTIGLVGVLLLLRGGFLTNGEVIGQSPQVRIGTPTELTITNVLGTSSSQAASWYDNVKSELDTKSLLWMGISSDQSVKIGPIGSDGGITTVFQPPVGSKQYRLFPQGIISFISGKELFLINQPIYKVEDSESLISYAFDASNKETYLLIKTTKGQRIRTITSRGQTFTTSKSLDFDLDTLIRYSSQKLYGQDAKGNCWEVSTIDNSQNNITCQVAFAIGSDDLWTNFRSQSVSLLSGQILKGSEVVYDLSEGQLAKDPATHLNRVYFRKFQQFPEGEGFIAREVGIFSYLEGVEEPVLLLSSSEKIKQMKLIGSKLYVIKYKSGVEEVLEIDLVASSTITPPIAECQSDELCSYQIF